MEAEEGEGTEERQTGGVLLPPLPPSVRTAGNKSPLSISLLTALYWARSDKEQHCTAAAAHFCSGPDPRLTQY